MTTRQPKGSLLGRVETTKKRAAPIKQHTQKAAENSAPSAIKAPSRFSVGKGLLVLVALLLVLFPKPKLITYQKANVTSQSVYWPGIFSVKPKLLDSTYQADANFDQNVLYLCQPGQSIQSCQRYTILRTQGFFSALIYLVSN